MSKDKVSHRHRASDECWLLKVLRLAAAVMRSTRRRVSATPSSVEGHRQAHPASFVGRCDFERDVSGLHLIISDTLKPVAEYLAKPVMVKYI